MKRRVCILWALAWALLLAACGPAESDISPQPPDPGPLTLEALSVEVSRGELSAQELARAARELPEELKAALADRGVEAETVTVSIGSSPAAMAQAVREGLALCAGTVVPSLFPFFVVVSLLLQLADACLQGGGAGAVFHR